MDRQIGRCTAEFIYLELYISFADRGSYWKFDTIKADTYGLCCPIFG